MSGANAGPSAFLGSVGLGSRAKSDKASDGIAWSNAFGEGRTQACKE